MALALNSLKRVDMPLNKETKPNQTGMDSYRSYGSQTWPMKLNCGFFQAVIVSILLYGCTTWTLTKRLEKKFDGNNTRMLRAILNRSWRQHPTKQQLYGHRPPIMKTVQIRQSRHAGHCWRSIDELINDVLLWTPSHGRAKAGRPARTYIQQLYEDTGCSPEDLLEVMVARKVRDIHADGATWWWWWNVTELILSFLLLCLELVHHRNTYANFGHWKVGDWAKYLPKHQTSPMSLVWSEGVSTFVHCWIVTKQSILRDSVDK